jgi:DNA polymerase-1
MDNGMAIGIDFNNLFYSSYYQAPYINQHGMNVNAIKGFFFKLRFLKQSFEPAHIIIAKDVARGKTFRREMYPAYKAHRNPAPEEFVKQIPYALEILTNLGFPILSHPSYEGDDILGMLSRYCNQRDLFFTIASSDKDFFQLVNDKTYVFNMRERITYDIDEIYNRYGILPHQLLDLKALIGDTSDNIPGVFGIGDVIGLSLIKEFKSLDGVYSNLKRIRVLSIREKLKLNKKNAYLSYILGKIVTDHTLLNITEESIKRQPPNMPKVYEIIHKLGLSEPLNYMMRYDFS